MVEPRFEPRPAPSAAYSLSMPLLHLEVVLCLSDQAHAQQAQGPGFESQHQKNSKSVFELSPTKQTFSVFCIFKGCKLHFVFICVCETVKDLSPNLRVNLEDERLCVFPPAQHMFLLALCPQKLQRSHLVSSKQESSVV